jgi:hypothetical protein
MFQTRKFDRHFRITLLSICVLYVLGNIFETSRRDLTRDFNDLIPPVSSGLVNRISKISLLYFYLGPIETVKSHNDVCTYYCAIYRLSNSYFATAIPNTTTDAPAQRTGQVTQNPPTSNYYSGDGTERSQAEDVSPVSPSLVNNTFVF